MIKDYEDFRNKVYKHRFKLRSMLKLLKGIKPLESEVARAYNIINAIEKERTDAEKNSG
jgi:hypothetical protein